MTSMDPNRAAETDQGRPPTPEEARRGQSARTLREDAQQALAIADAAIAQLARDLNDVRETDLARILGVDKRTLHRWKSGTN